MVAVATPSTLPAVGDIPTLFQLLSTIFTEKPCSFSFAEIQAAPKGVETTSLGSEGRHGFTKRTDGPILSFDI